MENSNLNISKELFEKLKDLYDSDNLTDHIDNNKKNEMFDSSVRFTGNSDKEIVIHIKSLLYEKNEKGETTSPCAMVEQNFYIPLSKDSDHDIALESFMQKLFDCISTKTQEVNNG